MSKQDKQLRGRDYVVTAMYFDAALGVYQVRNETLKGPPMTGDPSIDLPDPDMTGLLPERWDDACMAWFNKRFIELGDALYDTPDDKPSPE
jgi:hypothetical protein